MFSWRAEFQFIQSNVWSIEHLWGGGGPTAHIAGEYHTLQVVLILNKGVLGNIKKGFPVTVLLHILLCHIQFGSSSTDWLNPCFTSVTWIEFEQSIFWIAYVFLSMDYAKWCSNENVFYSQQWFCMKDLCMKIVTWRLNLSSLIHKFIKYVKSVLAINFLHYTHLNGFY